MTDEQEEELCRRYEGRIRSYGRRHLRNAAAVEDLVQNVLIAVLQAVRAGRVEQPERLGAYVLGTCRYAVRDLQRGEERQRKIAVANAQILPDGYELNPSGLDRRRVEECLMGLGARDRGIVLATFVQEQDAEEIGKAFEVSAGNVRVIRHRALAKLQACVEGGSR